MNRARLALVLATVAHPVAAQTVLNGPAAYGDWHADAPGVVRHLTAADLPPPYSTRSSSNTPSVVGPPAGAAPHAPPGFTVTRFAAGLAGPRLLRTAPNGDVFVSEMQNGEVHVLRAPDGAPGGQDLGVFAELDSPFGIAFYPPGPNPQFVYVAETNRVVRYPYRNGDVKASGPAQVIVPKIADTTDDHVTRDILFSPDGRRMFLSVGSDTNVAQSMPRKSPAEITAWQAAHGLGAAWGGETDRAQVLEFDPQGGGRHAYATGIRNCVGLALNPVTASLWCSTNERDGLGDNVPPDYVTSVREGGFYGWPWWFIGGHEDPRHKGERPDLQDAALVPDTLIQPHSAPLQMTFYPPDEAGPAAFPAAYRGDAFVALHGSWNRSVRTGYKVVRVRLRDGAATGEYEDFLTGFVAGDDSVWGRPVGVTVAHDGALLVSEDANGTIWRVAATR
jgi:glucose/arabinose dehydrogenase